MAVKPNELSNLCAIYKALRTPCIIDSELERLLYASMLIDTDVKPTEIISEALCYGLIKSTDHGYTITNIGKELGRMQMEVAFKISEKAKEFMVKKLYLNPDFKEYCCGKFLEKFRADTNYNTLVYNRNFKETQEEIRWLTLLSNVGLLIVLREKALVEKRYLDQVNKLLLFLHEGPINTIINSNIRNQVGDVAEKCAMQYEKTRLENSGCPELAKLVQCISNIHNSAGYDIVSFSGEKGTPEEPRYIEVKGTISPEPQFTWSRNERFVAQKERGRYWIYCYYKVDIYNKIASGPLKIRDPIQNIESKGFISEPLDVYCYITYKNINNI